MGIKNKLDYIKTFVTCETSWKLSKGKTEWEDEGQQMYSTMDSSRICKLLLQIIKDRTEFQQKNKYFTKDIHINNH